MNTSFENGCSSNLDSGIRGAGCSGGLRSVRGVHRENPSRFRVSQKNLNNAMDISGSVNRVQECSVYGFQVGLEYLADTLGSE